MTFSCFANFHGSEEIRTKMKKKVCSHRQFLLGQLATDFRYVVDMGRPPYLEIRHLECLVLWCGLQVLRYGHYQVLKWVE